MVDHSINQFVDIVAMNDLHPRYMLHYRYVPASERAEKVPERSAQTSQPQRNADRELLQYRIRRVYGLEKQPNNHATYYPVSLQNF